MRRQTKCVRPRPRWFSGILNIDPFLLPARYELGSSKAVGRFFARHEKIVITSKSVAVGKFFAGRLVAVKRHDISAFKGVCVDIEACPDADEGARVTLYLLHDDPDLCLPLYIADDLDDAGARWHSWSRVLRLPLLMPSDNGRIVEPIERLGKLVAYHPFSRRRTSTLAKRRPRLGFFRKVGSLQGMPKLDGAEIIARH